MDIFNSQWLLNMLVKSSKTPQGRILSLFDILGDWLNAPNIDHNITDDTVSSQQLIIFCTTQAKACGATNPSMLAEQKEWPFSDVKKPFVYTVTASFLVVLGAGAIWQSELMQLIQPQTKVLASVSNNIPSVATHLSSTSLTAHDAANMYAKYELMRNGTCQFPEALQIPDKDKSVYLENVVGGKLPTDLEDLATANYYLEKVHCNFTPMLMAHSK